MDQQQDHSERRRHRRLAIHLPVQCVAAGQGHASSMLRATTRDISTGGVYFEAELGNGVGPGDLAGPLDVELTVPPGDGYFPYEGRVRGVIDVVRCDSITDAASGSASGRRVGIGGSFREPLQLAF